MQAERRRVDRAISPPGRRARVPLLIATTCAALLAGCDATLRGGPLHGRLQDGGTDTRDPGRDARSPLEAGAPDVPVFDPETDTDGDGLPDDFEALFDGFDPESADSDGDGIPDGDEDKDGDGLTALEEWAAYQDDSAFSAAKPSPLHRDLLVELDYQTGHQIPASLLQQAIAAFAAVDLENIDGQHGINLHLFVDEQDLPLQPMSGDLEARMDYLGAHGPKNLAGAHTAKMVHVIVASERPDAPARGGEVVGSSEAGAEKAGALIYRGNLLQLFPACAGQSSAAVTVDEALVSTLVHELGHTLQLGHDTEVGGGVNPYNIMATDLGECHKLKQRTRGVGNADPALGATETDGGPRFSRAAAELMKLRRKISVEASTFDVEGGYEM